MPPLFIRLNDADNVVIARATLPPGTVVDGDVTVADRVPAGHKVATRPIAVAGTEAEVAGQFEDILAAGAHELMVHPLLVADESLVNGVRAIARAFKRATFSGGDA